MTKIYMAVTADEYELPLGIEDTAKELADKLGIKEGTVYSCISRKMDGKRAGYRLIRIEIVYS